MGLDEFRGFCIDAESLRSQRDVGRNEEVSPRGVEVLVDHIIQFDIVFPLTVPTPGKTCS